MGFGFRMVAGRQVWHNDMIHGKGLPMKPTSPIFWLVMMFCLAATGCKFLVNLMAFYPDRSPAVPVGQLPPGTREITIPTPDNERLQAYFITRSGSPQLLIYFHGNAGNIGHRLPDLQALADMGLNVLGVGYRGYGQSSGRPSEAGIYTDGRAALAYAENELGFAPRRVILLGRSIGSTVAVEIAQGRELAGVVLVTPMTSGRAVARNSGFGPLARLAGNAFDNLSKIERVTAPLLVVHGTADEVIPFDQGRELHAAANPPKQFAAIPGAGHNDISLTADGAYWQVIRHFLAALPGN